MDPVTHAAAAVTIASGVIATGVAVGGVAAKLAMHVAKNKKKIVKRFKHLITHIHETDDSMKDDSDDGVTALLSRIQRELSECKDGLSSSSSEMSSLMYELIHPTAIIRTLNDLTALVGMYEDEFERSVSLRSHMGMHGAIAGAALIGTQVIDITEVICTGVSSIDSKEISAVVSAMFEPSGHPVSNPSSAIDETLAAFVSFLGALIRFDKRASFHVDSCMLGRTEHGHARFSIWTGSGRDPDHMTSVLKRIRDDVRAMIFPDVIKGIGKRQRDDTMEKDYTFSNDKGADGACVIKSPPVKKRKKTPEKQGKKK